MPAFLTEIKTKKLYVILAAALVLAACAVGYAYFKPPAPQTAGPVFDGISIKGDQQCLDQTNAALALLKQKSPNYFADVKNYVSVIECTPSLSGMYANTNPPRFVAGATTRGAGTVWYASAIAHDAELSRYYHEYQKSHPGQAVPNDVWIGRTAELQSNAAQYQVLSDLGAPSSTLEYLTSVINTGYYDQPASARKW